MIAPAAMTTICFHFFIPGIVRSKGISNFSSSPSSSSPAIATNPPIGSARIDHCVSPFCRFQMTGPIPIENSLQYTPNFLAAIR